MDTAATGPEQIRAAFRTAIQTTADRFEELTAIAAALIDAADQYEGRRMRGSTVAHLRAAGSAVTAAADGLCTAEQALQDAVDDFNVRDGAVADAVADTGGNLATAPILVDTAEAAMTDTPRTTVNHARAGTHSGQPLPDVLGITDDDTILASDRVPGVGPVATDLTLIDDPGSTGRYPRKGGRYVEVATPHPDKPDDQTASPCLSPDEAEAAAGHLEELAARAEAGQRPAKPRKHARAAQRIQHMLEDGTAQPTDKIAVGEDEEFPLTTIELLTLLRGADPAGATTTTRHKVVAKAAADAGGDSGALWIDLDPDGRIAVTAIEGTQDTPDDEFWQPYTAHHTPASARELAGKLRAFATTARTLTVAEPLRETRTQQPPAATPGTGRRVRNGRGEDTEYDPATGISYLYQPDGYRAPIAASTPTAVAARLLYMREEIKDGRGGHHTDEAARALLQGMTVNDLREVAAEVGSSTGGSARTRAALIDLIVNLSVGAARKSRALRRL